MSELKVCRCSVAMHSQLQQLLPPTIDHEQFAIKGTGHIYGHVVKALAPTETAAAKARKA